jgi:hypothetical protein
MEDTQDYRGPVASIAVLYGLESGGHKVFADYSQHRHLAFVDLGYFGRRMGGRWSGYHKITLNDRHPSAYYRRGHDSSRLNVHKVQPQPWRRSGEYILVAGMGDKGSAFCGFHSEQWERDIIRQIKSVTKRPIIYRPKPSWKAARPIEGTNFSPRQHALEDAMRNCWAVVSHHSNVSVDALIAGIPAFTWQGVAAEMSLQDISRIEDPWYPPDRESWLADIAFTQWSVAEMRDGLPWRYLRSQGLIP